MDEVVERLRAAGCVAAEEEAVELRRVSTGADLEQLVRRRIDGEPLAWVVGSIRFGALRLAVEAGVYVPRAQSVELARRAVEVVPADGLAADLCCGCGAIAATIVEARPAATVLGADVDPLAVRCARRNGVLAFQADLSAAPLRDGAVDVVTAVAPYVPTGELRLLPADVQAHEPSLALDGGHDGLALVRGVIATAARLLRPGGSLLVELGGDQDAALADDLAGFDDVVTWHDEDGDLRGLHARLGDRRQTWQRGHQ